MIHLNVEHAHRILTLLAAAANDWELFAAHLDSRDVAALRAFARASGTLGDPLVKALGDL
jgi:hypothetical protein